MEWWFVIAARDAAGSFVGWVHMYEGRGQYRLASRRDDCTRFRHESMATKTMHEVRENPRGMTFTVEQLSYP